MTIKNEFSENNFNATIGNTVLPAVIDKQVKKLTKMQVDLMSSGMEADDFNEISEMISNLKEFMVNCQSYNGR